MVQKMLRVIMISGILFFALIFPAVPVLAQEETETAGVSLGKETDEENRIMLYRTVEGWVQDDNGWWYQYSDGSYPTQAWRKIGESWYYFDDRGYLVENNTYEKGTLKGIDVSAWQGEIDWQAVKDFGIQFAFVRIGHGSQAVDRYFARNMQGAVAAGIPAGVYYYSTAVTEAEAVRDAQFVIDSMNGYLVSYPVAIDLEDKCQESLSKQQLGKIAKIFCDEIRAAGYTPMLYCNENWYKNYIDITQITDVEKWIARYNVVYTDSISRGIWQCSSRGRVNGINGNVDIDFGYKDYSQIVTPRTGAQSGYQKTKGTWQKDSRGWWFRYWDGGYPVDTWEQILGEWYLFDKDGYMVTGWKKIEETWYYLDASGARKTGWLLLGNTWYYLDEEGRMATGWQQLGGAWYYLEGSGAMHTGWLLLDNTWYYLEGSGAMRTGWLPLGNTWYHLEPDGRMSTGLTEIGGAWYYLDGSGAMRTGWVLLDGMWYYFEGSGAMHTGWLLLGNTWYYLESDGRMSTGLTEVGGTWYYLDGSGAMRSGWVLLDGIWYYFEGSGAMHTGWLLLGNTWYYLDKDGKMVTGEQQIDGVNYQFRTDGSWIG